MLRILLCLQVIFVMTESLSFQTSQKVNIGSCPYSYYGKKYENLFFKFLSDKAAICFNSLYDAKVKDDCILIPKLARNLTIVTIYTKSRLNDRVLRPKTVKSPLQCCVALSVYHQISRNYKTDIFLCNYGTQAAFYSQTRLVGTFEYEMQVNGIKMATMKLTNRRVGFYATKNMDISRCRYEGKLYTASTKTVVKCVTVTCNPVASLSISKCGPLELCKGSVCVLDATCTVTGPTVKDFHGRISTIQDRCAYPLVMDKSSPNFKVQANFQERRRKDVSFLDMVTLRVNTDDIQLEQGGRVRLNSKILTLDSSMKEFKGVGLFKDQTGVTANLSVFKNNITVFFDGYTTQIHVKGLSNLPQAGLCVNAMAPLAGLRLSKYSPSGCEKIYKEKADGTINCRAVNDSCNLLMDKSFAACHNHADPVPYINACNSTLCKYPSVDGLSCQFLEAYVRACSLHVKDPPTSWRSTAGCPAKPMAYCQNKVCSAHEFCGDMRGGTRCLCRSIFADPYRSSDTLGNTTICNKNSASLTLVNCLLDEKNIDHSLLHLNNQACKGQEDKENHMVTFNFDSRNTCGTVVTANSSHVMFKNAIKAQKSTDVIARQDQVSIDFSCFYNQPDLKTMSFKIKDSSVIQEIVSGAWKYTLTMKAYTDANRKQAVDPNAGIQLNQKIWVQLSTAGLEGSMVNVVTDSCWATKQKSSTDSLRYDLIKNGCANTADQTVKVEGNGVGMSNYFSFNMFQFSGKSGDVYLHCKLHLCIKQKSCIPVCKRGDRRRRSVHPRYEGDASAVITMAWGH